MSPFETAERIVVQHFDVPQVCVQFGREWDMKVYSGLIMLAADTIRQVHADCGHKSLALMSHEEKRACQEARVVDAAAELKLAFYYRRVVDARSTMSMYTFVMMAGLLLCYILYEMWRRALCGCHESAADADVIIVERCDNRRHRRCL